MARTKKMTTALVPVPKRRKKSSALANRLRRQIRARKQAERDAMLPMVLPKAAAPKKRATTKKRTTTAKKLVSTGSSVISPVCRRAGRKLKTKKLSSAGKTLGSKICKTKSGSTSTAAKRTYKKRTTTTAKKTATRKTTARKTTTRKSSAASKLARVRKIVC